MEFVRAKEILEAIKKLDHNSEDSVMAALGIAEHIERASLGFYEEQAEKTNGTELEAFFKFLVKEEAMHLAKILELGKMVKSGKPHKIAFERHKLPDIKAVPVGGDEMASILYALWREKKAAEFYSGAAEKTTGAVKAFFNELTEFEKTHVALFEEYVEDMINAGELIMG